ncbi:hypothetical protein ABH935_010021 [Catenulispora sp. GAS73]
MSYEFEWIAAPEPTTADREKRRPGASRWRAGSVFEF